MAKNFLSRDPNEQATSLLPRYVDFTIFQQEPPLTVAARRRLGKNGFLRIKLLIFSGIAVPFAAAIAQQTKGFRTFRCVLQPVSEKNGECA